MAGPFLPQPPRPRGDPTADNRAQQDWQWKFFQALAVDNRVLTEATEYADPGALDPENLPVPTETTIAKSQQVANAAYALASGLSANLRAGSVTVSGAATTGSATFSSALDDALYSVALTRTGVTGSPAANSDAVASIAKTASGFTVTVKAAPGAGTAVTFDYVAIR